VPRRGPQIWLMRTPAEPSGITTILSASKMGSTPDREPLGHPPADGSERAVCLYSRFRSRVTRLTAGQQPPKLLREIYVVDHQSPGASEQSNAENHQQVLQSQHGVAPFCLTPGRSGGGLTVNSATHAGPEILPAESQPRSSLRLLLEKTPTAPTREISGRGARPAGPTTRCPQRSGP
jgi:hypothetical protein